MPLPEMQRRRSTRLEVVSIVRGTSTDGHGVRVINVSDGGLLVHTATPMRVQNTHEFRFMSDDEQPAALFFPAVVAHIEPSFTLCPGYLAGLAFLEARTGRQTLAMRRLIELCTLPPRQVALFPEQNQGDNA